MMSVITFLDKLFGRNETSRDTAKNRLKLVLVHDRAAIPPQMLEQMRTELLAVLSKYVEIDQQALEMNLERSDGSIALLANIPIKRVRNEQEVASGQPAETTDAESKEVALT